MLSLSDGTIKILDMLTWVLAKTLPLCKPRPIKLSAAFAGNDFQPLFKHVVGVSHCSALLTMKCT